ncbi:hypothetical protein [Streptomyces sp. SID13726]|uniref:hypothetical protein n=1 Tax=Streptomyces sp. SID13726 TaxID=2706058 RepID=UPI0013B633BF|nr:hypothetical protein [Streptomyces sp. SID13726]NEB02480.1 hypothetical protein [Streptomyces sp. SID13726]
MNARMRTLAKAGVPALVAVAVGAVAFSTSLPDTSPTRAAKPPSGGSAPKAAPQQAVAADPEDPATWRLPIEAYMPTQAQTRLISGTRDDLLDACMDKAGYPAWTPPPDLPVVGGKTLTDWRYGIHDAALAAKNGYHPDPAQQAAYDEAASVGAVDKSGADDSAVRACVSQVDGVAPASPVVDLVQQISGDAFRGADQATNVVAVFNQWASCMKAKGYTYAKPMDANDDPAFADPYTISSTEIATATADVACRDKYQVEKVWFDAEAKLQQTAIAQHQDELDDVKAATAQAVAKAKAADR